MMRRTRTWWRSSTLLLAGALVGLSLALAPPAASAAGGSTSAATATKCKGYSWFGGVHWCPADAIGVQKTAYGQGRRVWLKDVRVTGVDETTVTVAQYVPCPPGHFCGAAVPAAYNDYNYLTLQWSAHRPKVTDVVRLYGTTTVGTITPAGYVRVGSFDPGCMDPLGCCDDFC